jgi:hypothetical protein
MRAYSRSRKSEHRSQFAETSGKRATIIIFLPRENAPRGEIEGATVRGVNNNVATQMEIKVTRNGI